MKILSIETSCDETAVSIVEANGDLNNLSFNVLGNSLISQINIHKEYGGVFPKLAKREHAKNLCPILIDCLKQAGMYNLGQNFSDWQSLEQILSREEGLFDSFKNSLSEVSKPDIDVIAVTYGPGLEPALWVGISFANALSKFWSIPVIPANHMEGHITSVLVNNHNEKINFPCLALLISGGHTEIVNIPKWGEYQIIGETVDDAVGEAFDKVARLLDLPYPGGPEISKLAEKSRRDGNTKKCILPRPMLHTKNYNFSFSGLKTAVLYYIRDNYNGESKNISLQEKEDIAREFEDAVVDVLLHKTKSAINDTSSKTLIIAGGVIANKKIREEFKKLEEEYGDLKVIVPTKELSTDNSIMIASATYIRYLLDNSVIHNNFKIIAQGNLKLK